MQHNQARQALSAALATFAATLLLAGCGEFTYKRGAGAADLEQDRSACHVASKGDADYQKCMNDRGWVVQNLDEPIMASVGVSSDNRGAAVTAPAPMVVSPTAENGAAPAVAAASGSAATTPASAAPTTAAPPKPADPMDKLTVNSWWKFGGTTGELQATIDACVATLGDAHKPEAGKPQMTRGLLKCLREKGWYGVANR